MVPPPLMCPPFCLQVSRPFIHIYIYIYIYIFRQSAFRPPSPPPPRWYGLVWGPGPGGVCGEWGRAELLLRAATGHRAGRDLTQALRKPYACMHACMHAWMHVCMYVYIYIYIYIHISFLFISVFAFNQTSICIYVYGSTETNSISEWIFSSKSIF